MSNRSDLLAPFVDRESVCSYAELPERLARYPVYRQGLDWLRGFIMRPHPDLNRPGHVCPFVVLSAKRDALTFACMSVPEHTAEGCLRALLPLREVFFELEPRDEPDRYLKALLLFFPDLPAQAAPGFIDGGHWFLKPHFVDAGLMLGEFHPTSEVAGSTNPAFRPMRSAVPAMVVREMSSHDIRFLATPREPRERQERYLAAFLRHMAGRAPRDQIERARILLEGLRAEADSG